jgi:hypothetical protein
MNFLLRVASLVKIVFFEQIAMFCLGGAVLKNIILTRGGGGCPGVPGSLAWGDLGYLAVGLACAAWLVWRILWPAMVKEIWRPALKAGGVVAPNPVIPTASYIFPSTHPSYVLVELFFLSWWLYEWHLSDDTLAYFGCVNLLGWALPRALSVVGLFFPALRLFSWFILGRKISKEDRAGAWKPVAYFYAIVGPIILLLVLGVGTSWYHRQQRPVVSEATLAGGLSKHPEFVGKQVQLVGKRKVAASFPCTCPARSNPTCGDATLVDLGDGGDALVLSMYSGELQRISKGQVGTTMPGAYGVIAPMPPDSDFTVPDEGPLTEYRDFSYVQCGEATDARVPPQGRVLLIVDDDF